MVVGITIEVLLSSSRCTPQHCGDHNHTEHDRQAPRGKHSLLSPRGLGHRLDWHWRLQGHPLELRQRKILIEVDCSSIGAYLGAPVEPARYHRQVVAFERLQVAPGDLRLVRDLFEGQTATFTGSPE